MNISCHKVVLLILVTWSLIPANTHGEQVFAFNNLGEPETLDPTIAAGPIEEAILNALFEGLTSKDPKTLEPVPGVAQRWKLSKDGKTYTFHLRKDARWRNGDRLTASDFVYAWQRLLNPATGATLAYHLYYVVGAEDYVHGKLDDFSKVGIRAIDRHTLEVRLKHPVPYFLYLCSFYPLFPVHKKTIEKHGKRWTRVENIVSNGPFTLRHWRPNDRIIVEKANIYWDRQNILLDKVVFYAMDNKETGLNLYKTGKIHWTGRSPLPVSRLEELRQRNDYHEPTRLATDFIRLNLQQKPFDNILVRKALSLAIDRQLIVDKVTKTGERPAHSLSLRMGQYTPPQTQPFNPKQAAKLLNKAGFCAPGLQTPNCQAFPKVELLYNTNRRHELVMLAIQQMWRQHLGIKDVVLINREWKTYVKNLKAREFSLIRTGWVVDFPDPISFIEVFVTGGSRNFTSWGNKQYDQLVADSRLQTNATKRLNMLHKAESILMEELPIIPIYHYTSSFLLSDKVSGFYGNYMGVHPYKGISLNTALDHKQTL